MRDGWNGFRADFLASISTLQAERDFRQLPDSALQRFESPSALVAYLNSPSGNLDEKDRIYQTLVEETQLRGSQTDLAWSLVWLGLWPGLDHIYRRRVGALLDEPDVLVEAISTIFTEIVGRADLRRINRLAATLVLNTDREVRRGLQKRWDEAKNRRDLPERGRLEKVKQVDPRFLSVDGPATQELAALRARFLQVLGPKDVELVLDVVGGATQKEAGARQGLSHGASRKRYKRAIDRLREAEGVVPLVPRTRRFSDGGGRR